MLARATRQQRTGAIMPMLAAPRWRIKAVKESQRYADADVLMMREKARDMESEQCAAGGRQQRGAAAFTRRQAGAPSRRDVSSRCPPSKPAAEFEESARLTLYHEQPAATNAMPSMRDEEQRIASRKSRPCRSQRALARKSSAAVMLRRACNIQPRAP
jgi:hypothetical protein